MNKLYKILNSCSFRLFAKYGIWILLFIAVPAWADPNEDYTKYCSSAKITEQYQKSGCWSCDIILVLCHYMVAAIELLSDAIVSISKIILSIGAALWYAVYFLKALSSMSVQDPAKIIDGAIVFGFKVGLSYALVATGIQGIVGYIVNPLLGFGYEVGTTFASFARVGV